MEVVTRIHLDDEEAAHEVARIIDGRGHEVAVVRERFAGEDDDEAVEFVVCTPARREDVADLVADDVFITSD